MDDPPPPELPAELRACARAAHAPGAADPGALTECEARLLRDGARAWIDEHGRIALEPGDFVVAFSDLHGDARMLQLHLRNAGLVGLVGGAYAWLNPRAVVVICGDVVDDHRPSHADGADRDALLNRAGFDGCTTGECESGTNTWSILMTLNFLAAQGARIVALVGNHEMMRVHGSGYEPYARASSLAYERWRDGPPAAGAAAGRWGPRSVLRRLFNAGAPMLAAACAGDALFLHADAPVPDAREPAEPADVARDINAALALAVGDLDADRPVSDRGAGATLNAALWGRALGTANTRADCERLGALAALVVRGHCPNRPRSTADPDPRGHAVARFAFADDDRAARTELLDATALRADAAADVAVVRAAGTERRPSTRAARRGAFSGISFACARGAGFHGAVLRVDCGASLAFGAGRAPALVVLTFAFDGPQPRVDRVFCVKGAPRALRAFV
jgi:hypothetical protein